MFKRSTLCLIACLISSHQQSTSTAGFFLIDDKPCAKRNYGSENIVCVCNMTYCDTINRVLPLSSREYIIYTSTKAGLRFNKTKGMFDDEAQTDGAHFFVNLSTTYQTILGFGGAFTDAAGINIESLSMKAKENLLQSYFSKEGIEFNFGRVPIAGCDFSTHEYTYDDAPGDTNLTYFNLTVEDFFYKIPLIKEAMKLSKREFHLLAAAWTAPPWMKTNDDYSGFGFLKEEYYEVWTEYLIKFLDKYEKEGLYFWGISTGNEPINGIIPVNRFNSMGWTPSTQTTWIKEHLGPALKKFDPEIKLIALDDQRFMLPWWINKLMSDEEVASYIDGIGVHWYWDSWFPACLLGWTHQNFPDKFILATEASVGDKPWDFEKVKIGSWTRGEWYMEDILEDLNNWVTGWIDWNLALDLKGGPNWANNFVDSAVIVNASANEFYKQPMFYALGHFSKFLPEGSVRVELSAEHNGGIQSIGFLTPDDTVVIILYNKLNSDSSVSITDSTRHMNIAIPKRSFNTVIYKAMT
ncbi:hypothetical protein L9F63_000264 [Diploptera punctata]|uniref:Glucosylceramidase n=1 Tax=Diploptera punctata TaxID=6984 RepID=A0AAD8AM03_DIPPU|nr:hypothetical protein L9F63_000264 [Diploptera punctata]